MKFFADENVARAIVNWLRRAGNDVLYAVDIKPGEADSAWLRQSEAEGRVVLTSDKDFGELVFRDHLNSHGVILLRMERLTIGERVKRFESVWPVIEANGMGKFVVLTENKVRMRGLREKG